MCGDGGIARGIVVIASVVVMGVVDGFTGVVVCIAGVVVVDIGGDADVVGGCVVDGIGVVGIVGVAVIYGVVVAVVVNEVVVYVAFVGSRVVAAAGVFGCVRDDGVGGGECDGDGVGVGGVTVVDCMDVVVDSVVVDGAIAVCVGDVFVVGVLLVVCRWCCCWYIWCCCRLLPCWWGCCCCW